MVAVRSMKFLLAASVIGLNLSKLAIPVSDNVNTLPDYLTTCGICANYCRRDKNDKASIFHRRK
jgi:hypothetical protein